MPKVTALTTKSPTQNSKSKGSIFDRIVPMSFDDEGIKILMYGRSGTGKTTLWGTFPKPILAIICSGGKKAGELRSLNTAENRKVIRQFHVERTEEIREIVENPDKWPLPFKTIVVDHVTGLQDKNLAEIIGIEEMVEQKHWGLATQQQYGQCTAQTKEILKSVLNSSLNVVLLAQERTFGGKEEGAVDGILPTIGASGTPSLISWLNTSVDYICQTFIRQKEITKIVKLGKPPKVIEKKVKEIVKGQVEYCLRTAPDAIYTTKFRAPVRGVVNKVPELIIDPDYDKILKVIHSLGN